VKTVLNFKLEAGGKTYEGQVTIPDDDGTCTLPMMINSLMVNLARDCPEIHQARSVSFTASLP
jgi:hypothetical protein